MIRVGTGYDLHRLEPGSPFILGGVTIPHDRGLSGHSDADVLCHAIIDALFGAAALGNIGRSFPDIDPCYKNANSLELLREAVESVRKAGYRIVNIDTTVVAERPSLDSHTVAISESLADVLELESSAISVKPKTNEGVGPEGRKEAISVYAVVLIETVSEET